MRTMLMLALIAAGCTDEHMDPHVLGPDCGAAWEPRSNGIVWNGCEIGCASGEAMPPLVEDGECNGADAWTVVEYDGVLGSCRPVQHGGTPGYYLDFVECD